MPYSSGEGKGWMLETIRSLQPRTILDVGPGWGTYSRLLTPVLPDAVIECVEVHIPYVDDYRLTDLYDVVHIGDIRTWLWPHDFDLVIFGDVLEHLTADEAESVWNTARSRCTHLVASVPTSEAFWAQGPAHGNDHESHLHHWTYEQLMQLPGVIDAQHGDDITVLLAEGMHDG